MSHLGDIQNRWQKKHIQDALKLCACAGQYKQICATEVAVEGPVRRAACDEGFVDVVIYPMPMLTVEGDCVMSIELVKDRETRT